MSYGQRPYSNTKFSDFINAERSNLTQLIDVQHGLPGELLALKVLTLQQIETINSQTATENKVNKLLDYVICFSLTQRKLFFKALYQNGQSHINNYIIANGSCTEENNENWPLVLDPTCDNFFEKWPKVTNILDTTNGLLDEMLSAGCINIQHKQTIKNQSTDAQKNE